MDPNVDDDFSKIADETKREQMKEHCKIQFSVQALYNTQPQEIRIRYVGREDKEGTQFYKFNIINFKNEEMQFEKRYGEYEAFHNELVKTITDPKRVSPYGASLHTLPVLPEKHIDKKVVQNLDRRGEDLRLYSLQILLHRGLFALELTQKFFLGNSGPKAAGFLWKAWEGLGKAAGTVTGLVKGVIGGTVSTSNSNADSSTLRTIEQIITDQTNTINFLTSTLELYEGKQELLYMVATYGEEQSIHDSTCKVDDPYSQHIHTLRGAIHHMKIVQLPFLALKQTYKIYEESKLKLEAEKSNNTAQHRAEITSTGAFDDLKSFLRHSRLVLREEFEIINNHCKLDLLCLMDVAGKSIAALNRITV